MSGRDKSSLRRIATLLLIVTSIFSITAQKRGGIDPTELDYESNLRLPEIPEKQRGAIRLHLNTIQDALDHLKFKTKRDRDKEIVTVVISCSELFAPNDTVLKENTKNRLQHFVKFLQYPTMYKVVIAVFTDDTGEPQYCDALSGARANAIDEYLTNFAHQKGYWDLNIVPYGMGSTYAVTDNSTIEARAANRRIEIHIIPEWQMIETAKAGKL